MLLNGERMCGSNLAFVLYLHFMISCFYDPCLTSSLSGPTVMLILFLWVIKNFYLQNNQFCWKKQKTLLKIIEGTLDHHSKTTSGKSIYIVRKHKPQWIHFSLLTDCSIVLLFVSVLITSSQLETGPAAPRRFAPSKHSFKSIKAILGEGLLHKKSWQSHRPSSRTAICSFVQLGAGGARALQKDLRWVTRACF